MERGKINHPFQPIYDENSKIIILGTIPSVKSRENQFYYGHPQNRFWKILSSTTNCKMPDTIEEKMAFLYANGIALWDVLKSCDIVGSGDQSIQNPEANPVWRLIAETQIRRVYTNGKKADALYRKYCLPHTNISNICLPSSSPANAAWSLERLTDDWRKKLMLT